LAPGENRVSQLPVKKSLPRHTANFEHVFGNIAAGRFQIRDTGSLFEDFGGLKNGGPDTAARGDGRPIIMLREHRRGRHLTARRWQLQTGLWRPGVHRRTIPGHLSNPEKSPDFPSPSGGVAGS
jgi:hypothetical protein